MMNDLKIDNSEYLAEVKNTFWLLISLLIQLIRFLFQIVFIKPRKPGSIILSQTIKDPDFSIFVYQKSGFKRIAPFVNVNKFSSPTLDFRIHIFANLFRRA